MECYTDLASVQIPKDSVVLLECMSNLVANEMFQENGAKEKTVEAVLLGVKTLLAKADVYKRQEHQPSLPMWDLHIGYGSDILTTLHYYVIGDPLTLPVSYTHLDVYKRQAITVAFGKFDVYILKQSLFSNSQGNVAC